MHKSTRSANPKDPLSDEFSSLSDEFPPPRSFERSAWDRRQRIYSAPYARNRYLKRRGDLIFQRRSHKKKAVAAIIVIVLVIAGIWAINSLFAFQDQAPTDIDNSPQSTPKTEWKRGSMPYLYQADDDWAMQPYGEGTVGDSGCGPTALTMAYIYLTGKTDKNPATMAQYSEENGFEDEGQTLWTLMSEGARSLGMRSRELPRDPEAIRAALEKGHPIICSMGPGDFTTGGHFIVLSSLESDNRVALRDPNSEERSSRLWDLSTLIKQGKNFWEFS